MAQTTIN